ncbi:hypothetical protein LJK87_33130 [Paenibacillus sp. P25]|nr:hypothetical protein LJK87_33130 [Paenibacillus sp. P25]
MMFALNALLLAGILIAIGVLLYLRMSRRLPERPDEKPVYTLEAMTAFVKVALHEMTSSNLIDFGLSEEEYRRRKNKRAELKKAAAGLHVRRFAGQGVCEAGNRRFARTALQSGRQ